MNTEMIAKTETFLKDTFAASTYLQSNPADRDYRLDHSSRVANIAKTIAEEHKGTLKAESDSASTRFIFTMPLKK